MQPCFMQCNKQKPDKNTSSLFPLQDSNYNPRVLDFPSSDVGVQLAADRGNAHSNTFILKCAHSVSVHVCGDADGSVLERERNHKHHGPFIHTHTVLG